MSLEYSIFIMWSCFGLFLILLNFLVKKYILIIASEFHFILHKEFVNLNLVNLGLTINWKEFPVTGFWVHSPLLSDCWTGSAWCVWIDTWDPQQVPRAVYQVTASAAGFASGTAAWSYEAWATRGHWWVSVLVVFLFSFNWINALSISAEIWMALDQSSCFSISILSITIYRTSLFTDTNFALQRSCLFFWWSLPLTPQPALKWKVTHWPH